MTLAKAQRDAKKGKEKTTEGPESTEGENKKLTTDPASPEGYGRTGFTDGRGAQGRELGIRNEE